MSSTNQPQETPTMPTETPETVPCAECGTPTAAHVHDGAETFCSYYCADVAESRS